MKLSTLRHIWKSMRHAVVSLLSLYIAMEDQLRLVLASIISTEWVEANWGLIGAGVAIIGYLAHNYGTVRQKAEVPLEHR